jgi:hypothetical protein
MTCTWNPDEKPQDDTETGTAYGPSLDRIESINERGKENRPVLAQDHAEAMNHVAGGRSWQSLKESKEFDVQRLNLSPLFERKLF